MPIVTQKAMIEALQRDAEFVKRYIGRALVAIFERQQQDEKSGNDVRYINRIGFTAADAKSGCITAKYFLKHGTLLDWQVGQWTRDFRGNPRISKYYRQLNQVAEEKRA